MANDASQTSRGQLLIAAVVVIVALGGIGFGLYRLVQALAPTPLVEVATEQPDRPGEAGPQRPGTRRTLAVRTSGQDGGTPIGVDEDSPHAKTQITGRVAERATGVGIVGAQVMVSPTFGRPRLGPTSGDGSLTVVTGRGGYYSLRGIPPGNFDLKVAASGFMPAQSSFRKFSAVEDDDGFDFELEPASIIEGRVVDHEGRPIAKAQIVALPEESSMINRSTPSTRSDAEGRFVLDPVNATELALFATHDTHAPVSTIVNASDAPVRSVVIKMGVPRWIEGTVSGDDGPIAGATIAVVFLHTEARGVYYGDGQSGGGARTDATGKYRLAMPALAHVKLRAEAAGHQPESRSVPIRDSNALRADFRLRAGVDFRGRVVDAEGAAAGGAQIAISYGRGGFAQGQADDDGRFTIHGVAPAGPYTIAIQHFGHPPLTESEVELRGEHEYRLDPPGRIIGTITDAETGAPVTEYAYRLSGPVRMRNVAVSLSGAIELDQLPPGGYALTVRAEGYETATVDGLMVGLGETVRNVAISMRRGGTIAGRLVGARGDGEVLIQAFFRSGNQEPSFEGGAVVAEDGSFIISSLKAGLYSLVAVGPGLAGRADGIDLAPGAVVDGIEVRVDARGVPH